MSDHEPGPINVDKTLIAMSPETFFSIMRWVIGTGLSLIASIILGTIHISGKLETMNRMQREQWTLSMNREFVNQTRILNPTSQLVWPDPDAVHQRFLTRP